MKAIKLQCTGQRNSLAMKDGLKISGENGAELRQQESDSDICKKSVQFSAIYKKHYSRIQILQVCQSKFSVTGIAKMSAQEEEGKLTFKDGTNWYLTTAERT